MNEEQYYATSKKEGVPYHCPLVGSCVRYGFTAYDLADKGKEGEGETIVEQLLSTGVLTKDGPHGLVPQKGDEFWTIPAPTCFSFGNACPEVPLFDKSKRGFIPAEAVTAGDWDNRSPHRFDSNGKFKVWKTQHYTKCAEFSLVAHLYSNPTEREPITKEPETERVNQDISKYVPEACPELTYRQAAFLIAYNKGSFGDHRSDNGEMKKLAEALCNRTSPTSGAGLYNKYVEVRSPEKRRQLFKKTEAACKSEEGKPIRVVNENIKALEVILPYVFEENKSEVEKDLQQWKKLRSIWVQ